MSIEAIGESKEKKDNVSVAQMMMEMMRSHYQTQPVDGAMNPVAQQVEAKQSQPVDSVSFSPQVNQVVGMNAPSVAQVVAPSQPVGEGAEVGIASLAQGSIGIPTAAPGLATDQVVTNLGAGQGSFGHAPEMLGMNSNMGENVQNAQNVGNKGLWQMLTKLFEN